MGLRLSKKYILFIISLVIVGYNVISLFNYSTSFPHHHFNKPKKLPPILVRDYFVFPRNPWLSPEKNNSRNNNREKIKIEDCFYTPYFNYEDFLTDEFISDYINYVKCRKKFNIPNKITASKGFWGELKLKTGYKYDIDNYDICPEDKDPPVVLYVVLSHLTDDREIIRETWGKNLRENERILFYTYGDDEDESNYEKLKRENIDYKDVLYVNEDNYDYISILAWLYDRCELTKFVVFTNTKSFINHKKMRTLISQEMYSSNRIYGNLLKRMQPDRNPINTHYITESDYPWEYFPPFFKNPTFVVSGDVIPRLLTAAQNIPMPINNVMRSIYVTGILPIFGNVMRLGTTGYFVDLNEVDDEIDICTFVKHAGINGINHADKMNAIWEKVENNNENIPCKLTAPCVIKVEGKCMVNSDKQDGNDNPKSQYHIA